MSLISLSFKSDKDLEQYLSVDDDEEIKNPTGEKTATQDSKKGSFIENNVKKSFEISHPPQDNDPNLDEEKEKEEEKEENEENEEKKEDEKEEILIREKTEGLILEKERSLFLKIFGPLEAGSIRGSIFNMVILSLGTGMLALPRYVSHTSLFFACLFIIGICVTVWWSLLLLSKACEKNKIFNYSKLIKLLYGKPLSITYDVIVILYSFGVLILFHIIIYATLGEAIYGLFFYRTYPTFNDFKTQSFWSHWYIQVLLPYIASIVIVYPMCLIKDVSRLRIISLIGVVSIIFLILIIIFQSKDFITYDKMENDINYFDITKGLKDKFDALNFISTIFYASCFHIGCVPVLNTLKNNVRRRINKAIRRTVLLDIFLYLIIAVIGYCTCPINTPSLIIQRPPLKEGDSDILMSLGKLGLVFTFFTKLPNTYSSLRITIFDKLFNTTEITDVKNYIVTLSVILICVTVSILYKDISSYIKIMGGLFSTLVGFIFPSLLIIKSNRRKRYHWKNILTLAFFIFLTIIGFISSALTIYGMIIGESN